MTDIFSRITGKVIEPIRVRTRYTESETISTDSVQVGEGDAVTGLWASSGELVPLITLSTDRPPGDVSTTSTEFEALYQFGRFNFEFIDTFTNISNYYGSFATRPEFPENGATIRLQIVSGEGSGTTITEYAGSDGFTNANPRDEFSLPSGLAELEIQARVEVDGEFEIFRDRYPSVTFWGEIE